MNVSVWNKGYMNVSVLFRFVNNYGNGWIFRLNWDVLKIMFF